MENSYKYWEKCWKEENVEELYTYLEKYNKCSMQEMEIFKEHHVTKVCDVACGFGAYSMAFASNGMLFHPYDWEEIDSFVQAYNVIYKATNSKNEKIVIIKK